ncbi:hypothetical protein MNEG_8367 [Monoraphidium neglectum]|uniref:Uncharacterized protein n=1 Tax=Monoraphidium neglectum TaxID=145388 RepID=A0A0D2M8I1_9CHLO|nr:hypothetical protein MNEG_8367 [Monoraphidium neglectum]KIY99594.1 hypothetical protein MNEG_8367 [Monoraphidium neglectum]|eukprot:XP_013898614.1 hypothetical protein MNEG_8367 [Monoraphidium neglectum]
MQALNSGRAASSRQCSTSGRTALAQGAQRCARVVVRAAADEQPDGRIIGGLGAVPGFGWWPIKAYRPCPNLDRAGIDYTRKGQATNEVLFGGVSLGDSQRESLERMQKTQERGLDVDI